MSTPFRFSRPVHIAFQSDPLASLNRRSDSTLILAAAALRAGAKVVFYTPDTLYADERGALRATGFTVAADTEDGLPAQSGEMRGITLDGFDYILMRQDPPFDMRYITYARMLERLPASVRVLNNPAAVCAHAEKLSVTRFGDLAAPTVITGDASVIAGFLEREQRIVLKPLYDCAGHGIITVSAEEEECGHIIDAFLSGQTAPVVAQRYLPEIKKTGDLRAVLFHGEWQGAFARMPPHGSFVSNLAAGGYADFRDITAREREICERVKPFLQEEGLFFAGLDIVGGYLTEINVTSPTGLKPIEEHTGLDTGAAFWRIAEDVYGENSG